MENLDFLKVFEENGFYVARLIAGSKRIYKENHPNDIVMFNANIIVEPEGKIWYGDLNITLDILILHRIAKTIDRDLYILWEMDARFGNESQPIEQLKLRSRITILKDGGYKINEKML